MSRYQARREETQKQLTDATDNLNRLTDLQSELKKQQKTLLRQAQSAKKYQALTDELNELIKHELLGRVLDAYTYLQDRQSHEQTLRQALDVAKQHHAAAKSALEAHSHTIARHQADKDKARDDHHQADLARQTAQHDLAVASQALTQATDSLHRLAINQETATDSLHKETVSLAGYQEELANISPLLVEIDDKLTKNHTDLATAQYQHSQACQALNALYNKKQHLENAQKLAHTQKNRLTLSQEKWQKKHDELTQEQHAINTATDHSDELVYWQGEIGRLTTAVHELKEKQTATATALHASGQHAKTLGQNVANLEKRHASLQSEYDTLHALLNRPSEKATPSASAHAHLPSVKEQIVLTEKGEKFAKILDKFLSFWLTAKVSTHLVSDCVAGVPDKESSAILCTTDKNYQFYQSLIHISELIASPNLTLWQSVYLLDDDTPHTALGERWQDELTAGIVILTKTGWVVGCFGVLHVSRLGASGDFLSQTTEHKQRLGVLAGELATLGQTLADTRAKFDQASTELDSLTRQEKQEHAELTALNAKLYQAKETHTTLLAKDKELALKHENHQKQAQALAQEKQELTFEINELEKELATAERDYNELLPNLQTTQHELKALNELMETLTSEGKKLSDEKQSLSLKQATINQATSHAQMLIDIAKNTLTQSEQERQKLHAEQATWQAKLPQIQSALDQATSHANVLKVVSDELSEQTAQLHAEQERLEQATQQAEVQTAHAQTAHAQATTEVAVADSRLADLVGQMTQLDATFELSAVVERAGELGGADYATRIHDVRAKIEKLGAVNLAAMAQLDELEAQITPMDSQIADITDSIARLNDAMNAIDDKTKSLFMQMLSAVNDELNALFSKVFDGGQASLTLMDDETLSKADKWRAGLVLMAQPKGKKNSRLAVLSGGEKTLTALSLIFAIFKQHPAPFCVLDEVDAPLDDANVGRFTSLIHELADSVQFIFISHNKLAMQTAHELKGITMPTAGISSLVTVDLEEAQQYVES